MASRKRFTIQVMGIVPLNIEENIWYDRLQESILLNFVFLHFPLFAVRLSVYKYKKKMHLL